MPHFNENGVCRAGTSLLTTKLGSSKGMVTETPAGTGSSFAPDNEVQAFQCVGSLPAAGGTRKGFATSVTEISQGVSAASDLLNYKEGTMEDCEVEAGRVGMVLKEHYSPKKLVSYVIIVFLQNGDIIFGRTALTDHDWVGRDHFHDGACLGITLSRAPVGETSAQRENVTEWQVVLIGLLVGFLPDDAHLVQCGFTMFYAELDEFLIRRTAMLVWRFVPL